MTDLTLYYNPGSFASHKALLALYEKEADFKRHVINIHSPNGDQNEPWFMRMNPKGVVPVLKDGEKVICESEDIIDYVDKHVKSGPTLLPDKSTKAGQEVVRLVTLLGTVRYEVITFGVFMNPELSPGGSRLGVTKAMNKGRIKRMKESQRAYCAAMMEKHSDLREAYKAHMELKKNMQEDFTDVNTVKSALEGCDKVCEQMEKLLKDVKEREGRGDVWLTGPTFTKADIILATLLNRLNMLGLNDKFYQKDTRPLLHDYFQRLQARRSFKLMLEGLQFYMSQMMRSQAKQVLPYVAAVVVVGVAVVVGFMFLKR